MVGIYKITSPSGRVYIGQSWNIEKRFQSYRQWKCKGQVKLYASFKKYRPSAHKFEVIHELPIDVDQETVNRYEELYLQCYTDIGARMLNIRGAGSNGKIGQETKDKLRAANLGKKHGDAAKLKLSIFWKGRPKQEGVGAKISAAKMGVKRTDEQKKRMSEAMKGRISSRKGKNKLNDSSYMAVSIKKKIPVSQYAVDGTFIKTWPSARDVLDTLGIGHVGSCCKGQRDHAGGFIWKYAS